MVEFKIQNEDKLQEMIDNKDFSISKVIVNSILSNINTKRKRIHILSFKLIDESTTFDLTLDKKYFAETLNENLKYYLEREMYEDCSRITKAIQLLNN